LINRSGGGLVFREAHVKELAACLSRLLKEPALLEQYRARGHSYVERTLTHAIVARDLNEKLRVNVASET
jgi:glycosyltransferase involved in cell wall biosynthesis